MSNQGVGNVYQQVIKDVMESSRVDFEEGGVDESVLEELRVGWEKKLSALGIAQFPWDPKPEPVQAPSQVSQSYPAHDMNSPQPTGGQNIQGGVRIKNEPGIDLNGMSSPSPAWSNQQNSRPVGANAAELAAYNLQAQYGGRASASINALQAGLPQNQQTHIQNQILNQQRMQMPQQNAQQHQQQQRPAAPQNGEVMTPVQYAQEMAKQQQHRMDQVRYAQPDLNTSQTDGVGDIEFGLFNRDANGQLVEMGRLEIDNMIRDKILANGRAMEGGGLMLPLKQGGRSATTIKSKRPTGGDAVNDSDDDGDDDEDAINSDLDDPDDGLNDEEEEDAEGTNVMLCMYDKVQRVKNKWKCVMKDGVVTINGKEYVFHKASGEYEW